ncbi:MAG TPA: TonB-dependent receptor [Opitutaceae bacterium]
MTRPARLVGLLLSLAALGAFTTLPAQEVSSNSVEDLTELSLEELLNTSVSTASKSAEKQSDAAGIISVLTSDELRRFGGITLRDILERVPGLIGTSVYMTDRSIVSTRGDQTTNSGNHTLLLIDGRPVRESLESGITSEVFEAFPVSILESVEVIKGPGSVLYGSNAFSGVINLITRKPETNSLSFSAIAGDGGAGGVAGDVTLKSGDFGLLAAVRVLDKPDWETYYRAPGIGHAIVERVTIPNEAVGAFLKAQFKALSFTAAYNQWETAYFVPDYMFLFPAFGVTHWDKLFTNLGYDEQLTDNWRTTANLTYTRSTLDTSSWPFTERDSNDMVAEWTNFLNVADRTRLTFGGLYSRASGNEGPVGGGPRFSDASRSGYAVYGQVDHQFTPALKGIAGVQANKIENIDLDIVPRAGLIWYPAPRVNVKALYSSAFRAPSVNETSLDYFAMQGNANLTPETIDTFDVSVSYNGERHQVAFNAFHSELSSIIYQDRSTGVPTYQNASGKITIQGVELEGKYYVSDTVFLTASLLRQDAEDDAGNPHVTPVAEWTGKAGVSYANTKGVTVGVFDVYRGAMGTTFRTQFNPSPRSYHKINVNVRLDLAKLFHTKLAGNPALVVQIDNLLDKEIWLPAWGLTPGQSLPYDPGRQIYGGLNFSF